jgi:hypothetical protein
MVTVFCAVLQYSLIDKYIASEEPDTFEGFHPDNEDTSSHHRRQNLIFNILYVTFRVDPQ